MDSNLSSISTWPRNQTPPRIINPSDSNNTNSNSNRVIFTATLANLKQYAKKHDSQKARELIQAIQNFLSVTDITDNNFNGISDRYQSNTIREEPHFDSMILCDTEKTAETRRIESNETNISNILHFPVAQRVEEPYEPLWIHAAPQILLTFFCISYLIIGAWIYQYYDPEIAKLPFHTVLTLTFQICSTLGWGNLAPTDQASRLFTLPYAVIGIPLMFACLSNYGRLIANGFSINWMFLTSIFRHKNGTLEKQPRKMPIKIAFNLLVFHQLIGVVLFNSAFGDLGVINSWYFVFLSSARLGLGDIIPTPRNLGETVIILFYFAFGNICMQAFLMSICYYIQRFYFVFLKMHLFKLHLCLKKKINC